nr:hypothetical protein [Sphingobacterium olei]
MFELTKEEYDVIKIAKCDLRTGALLKVSTFCFYRTRCTDASKCIKESKSYHDEHPHY